MRLQYSPGLLEEQHKQFKYVSTSAPIERACSSFGNVVTLRLVQTHG